MLISLASTSTAFVFVAASWLAKGMGDAPTASGNGPVTPRDPSTLTLALIGAATLAVYFVAKWRPSRTDIRRWTGRLSDQSDPRALEEAAEQHESRGAA